MIRKIFEAHNLKYSTLATAQENKNTHHHVNMRCDQDYVNNVYINKDSDDNVIL